MELSFVDHVVLGLLAVEPSHGYQLLDYFHDPAQLGRVWRLSTSQLYAMLKRLEQQGLIAGRDVDSPDAPTRTDYHLTAAGRNCVDLWLNDPQPSANIRRVRVECLARLYIARRLDLPVDAILAAQQAACRRQQNSLIAQRANMPPGTGALLLEFTISQLGAVLEWLDHCLSGSALYS